MRIQSPNHGAVFLLSVYLVALTMLLFGGVSLQRTMTETRAANLSRDVAQTFWVAEGAMDSTVRRLERQGLNDVTNQPVPNLANATFTIQTLAGQILSLNSQQLTRQITTIGRASTQAVNTTLSSTLSEEGPLYGVWANGLIVVHGGREFPNTFVSGNLYSMLGSVVSTVPTSSSTLQLTGLANVDDRDALTAAVSSEMLSLKRGYEVLEGIRSEDYTGIEFGSGMRSGSSEHVEGMLAAGALEELQDVPWVTSAQAGWLPLPRGSVTVIDDRYENAAFRMSDQDPASGHIALFARMIGPDSPTGFADVLLNRPPELVFRQPTSIYLMGNQWYNLNARSASFIDIPFGQTHITLPGWLTVAVTRMQPKWEVSFAAKVSAVDSSGRTIPNGVKIYQMSPAGALANVERSNPISQVIYPGAVIVKPGKFSGSIVAPHSLVMLRMRDEADRDESLQVQALVGNEVIIELDRDHVEFARNSGDTNAPAEADVTLLHWGQTGATSGTSVVDTLRADRQERKRSAGR